jgi:hypothetical protein
MHNGPEEFYDIESGQDVSIEVEQAKVEALVENNEKIQNVLKGLPLDEYIEKNLSNDEIMSIVFGKIKQEGIKISDAEEANLRENIGKMLPEDSSVVYDKAKLAAKFSLCAAVSLATLVYGGPLCAIAARSLFTAGFTAMYGTPSWLTYVMVVLPGKEWAGHMAFSYGPGALFIPAGVVANYTLSAAKSVAKGAGRGLYYAGSGLYGYFSNSSSNEENALGLDEKKEALSGYLKDFKMMNDDDSKEIMNLVDAYIVNKDNPEAKAEAFQNIGVKLTEVLSKPENDADVDMGKRVEQIVNAVIDIANTVDNSVKPRPKP